MFLQGTFVTPHFGSVTIMGAVYPSQTKTTITYSGGIITLVLQAGLAYHYVFNPREF